MHVSKWIRTNPYRFDLRLRAAVRGALVLVCAAMAAAAPSGLAVAQEWETAAGAAVAALPAPFEAKGISGAELRCAEQSWGLHIALAPEVRLPAPVGAELTIDGQLFSTQGAATGGTLVLPVAASVVELLKSGVRVRIAIAEARPPLRAGFSLRGSRRAIEAAAPFCSKRDMSGYDRIVLSPFSPLVSLGADLRGDEIGVFRQATNAQPDVAAEMLELADGKRLLFVEICGSSWYYGVSGCNLAALARDGLSADWRLVYDAEGADIYVDARTEVGGWPGIIALPKKGGGEEVVWTWSGDRYVASEAAIASSADGN